MKEIQINNDLLNIATPFGGMEFFRDKVLFGNIWGSTYAMIHYPNNVSYGWLSRITNMQNVVSAQVFEPTSNANLIKDLSRSVSTNRKIYETTRDELTRQRAERAAEDAQSLMRQIDENGEVIGYMSNFAFVMGHDEEDLRQNRKKYESRVSAIGCRTRTLINQQKEGLSTISPFCVPDEKILRNARRNVPLSTFMGGFPFSSNGFTDETGLPVGLDTGNGLVVVDLWKRGGDRTNSNGVIVGVPGVGKSTAAKLLMMNEFMTGTKILAIDPEKEYKEMAENLGGDVINAGGGKFKINPLQFQSQAYEADEDSGDDEGLSPMALHLNSLVTFFRLYQPSLSDMQVSILKQLLEGLYAEFHITWDTNAAKLKAEDYPIFSDFYEYILNLKQDENNSFYRSYRDEMTGIEIAVRELAQGGDQYIWNGHTTVEAKSNFVAIDTSTLQDVSEQVKKAQYFNILKWAWEIMSKDRTEKVMLFCDEAYILCDPQVPQSLVFLRNVAKRARKYSAGLWIITHSIVDFLHPSVKQYGQGVFDAACYKLIMGSDGQNLIEMTNLFNLTEAEQDIIGAKRRKQAIFFAGSRRFAMNVRVSDFKLALMGKGGGA